MAEQQHQQDKRAAVVINPMKVPDENFKENFIQLCTDAGWAEPLWLETTEEDTGAGQTRQALEAGVDVVIAAGGDGTVRCVAEIMAGTDTAMGLVPLGTGNLLARNLGIDVTDPLNAGKDVLAGSETKIDVINAVVDHGKHEQLFLVAAGVGYDATIMGDTIDGLKDRVGWLAYVESGLRKLPGKSVTAKVSVDGKQTIHHRVRSVMVGNCEKLMGGVEIFPDALVTDGALDLLILAPKGRFGWLGVIAGVFGKGRNRNKFAQSLAGKTAEIELDRPQEFQLDGDHLGTATHLQVTVAPLALTIRMTGSPK
ncbi:diacylglycerol kinase [Arthrobacter alpinus]|uniref:diacylglycerol/lipid kinase family protein n=1 Tax=Arthrobacter alpinus TaxID=656366 RepID=UPI0005C9B351|nr:diacylglycerol kinase family protein [Arthrobacter alpinus]ALV44244.1 diacylglycerol kinase [Arthrobacter alpinus]